MMIDDEMKNEVIGPGSEVRMRIGITRKATGKTEYYDLVGHVEQPASNVVSKEGVPPCQQP